MNLTLRSARSWIRKLSDLAAIRDRCLLFIPYRRVYCEMAQGGSS
jgi:hypothetical protein